MNNNDGALSFDAMIKDRQFNESIKDMERRIRGLSDTTIQETGKMDSSFSNLGVAIGGYFSATAITGFVKEIVRVRSEFQNFEAGFKVFLGTAEKGVEFTRRLQDFSVKNVFDFDVLARNANQLLAFRTESEQVIPVLDKLSEVAAGVNAPLDEMVNLYNRAKSLEIISANDVNMWQMRGIPLLHELAKMYGTNEKAIRDMVTAGKIGFKEVNDVIDNLTSEGGMFFGIQEEKLKTLGDSVGALRDELKAMFNELGENSEDFLRGGILSASYLVEHYKEIGKTLGVLIATYGAYKAAAIATVVVQNIAASSTKGWTAAQTLHYRALLLSETAQKRLNTTMLANPYVLAATLLVGLIVSLRAFSKESSSAAKAQASMSDAMKRSEEAATSEISKIKILEEQIKNESLSREARNEKLRELIELSPDHLQALTLETIKTQEGTKAINSYIDALKRKLQLQELESELTASLQRELEAENMENSASMYDLFINTIMNYNNEVGRQIDNAKDRLKANKAVVASEKEVQETLMEKITAITEGADATKKGSEEVEKSVIKTVQLYDDEIAALKKKQKEQSKTASEYKKFQKEIDQLEKEREAITGEAAAKQAKKDLDKKKKTFDEELDYKRKQYELYLKWIEFVGKNAADSEFKALLKQGESYSEYLKGQINSLMPKVLDKTATTEEKKQFSSLNIQFDDVTGAKSAMDVFKESISQAKGEAGNLIEYLEKLKDIRDDLGESDGLLGDDLNDAKRILSEEEVETDRKVQSDLIERYRSYEQQRVAISEQYDKQITYLRKIGEDERAKLAEKEKDKLISSLSVDELMNNDSWKNLFGNLDELTIKQIDTLIKEIELNFDELKGKFDPIDLIAVQDKLNQAKKILADDNPFKAIGEGIKIIFNDGADGAKKSAEEVYAEWIKLGKNTEAAFAFVTDAIDSADILKDAIGEVGATAIASLSSIAAVSISVAAAIKSTEKASVILAIVQAALVVVQAIANVFKSIFAKHDKNLEKQINKHKEAVDNLELSYSNLDRAINKALGDDFYRKQQEAIKNLEQQRIEVLKAQQAERDKKKTDNNKINEYNNQLNSINNSIEDHKDDIARSILQTDAKQFADELADAIVSAYSKGEDAALAFEEVSRKVMQDAVKNALKLQLLEKPIQAAVDQLQDDMGHVGSDGVFVFDGLSEADQKKFKDTVANIGRGFGEGMEAYKDLFKDIGLEVNTEEMAKSLEGSIKGITEETASVLAGTANAIRINQVEALALVREQLLFLQEIVINTRYNKHLESIDRKLDKLDSDPLRAKGLI